ncbi:MAG: sugar ABC transporter permease [Spirochaetaceae bacterium]|jgi:raffinose/stachyose/melibiose transport system permease protein|nr:sugar ABC transporter permease [Spirochaetaceae bacterium]
MTHLKKKDLNTLGIFVLFIIPALGAILLSVEIPFMMSVIYSFTKWNGIDRIPVFIALENYRELFTDDPDMMYALVFTLEQTVLRVILTNIIALLLAVFLDGEIRGKNVLRAAFYVPNIISLIVIGYIWFFVFSRGFNSFYQYVQFPPLMLSWLGDAKMAFFSVLIVSIWQSIGFYMVIYIAGLQVIPRDVIEAAMIDGAGGIARFFRITIPLIMPSITVAVFHSVSNSLKSFDVIFSLTNGGPGHSTTSIALDIYRTAFVTSRFGYGTAKSVVLFLLILLFTFFQVKFFKAREVEV